MLNNKTFQLCRAELTHDLVLQRVSRYIMLLYFYYVSVLRVARLYTALRSSFSPSDFLILPKQHSPASQNLLTLCARNRPYPAHNDNNNAMLC